MSEQLSVTICIVTYNSANDIEACLIAVKNQTWPAIDIAIVDNASRDNTVEIVSSMIGETRVFRNENNTGFAAGQNLAIAQSNSPYVLVLNPDVVLERDYVRKLVERAESDSSIGSATGCLTFISNPERIDSAGMEINEMRRASERGAGRSVQEFQVAEEVFGVSGAAALYSRRMINAISINGQFFDEDFFAYKEDVDVAWRAQLLGWKAWYEPRAKGIHGRNWGSRKDRKHISRKVRQHSHQNRYLMILKNEQFNLSWWSRLPKLVIYEVALHGYLLVRDPGVLIGCIRNLVRLVPSAWNKRRKIQALRQSF